MPKDVLFEAAGSLESAYQSLNWSATPIGAPGSWTPALVNALDNALHTRFPITLLWGPEFVLLYNEAYVELIADKHPAALGARARDVFPEAWDTVGPMMERVLAGDGPTWVQDAPVPLLRRGILEEAHFTFSYSPVRGGGGAIEGVMDIAIETTSEVVGRRRIELLRALNQELATTRDRSDLQARVLGVLRDDRADLPAVDLRIRDAPDLGDDARLPSHAPGEPRMGEPLIEQVPDGRVAWLALDADDLLGPEGWLVVLLSEHLAADHVYLGFLETIASTIALALQRLGALAVERRMSETLQRSLLAPPVEPDHLAVAVRYAPAAREAQVGGDWYDCFLLSDGSARLVIGDVTGHDQHAAAAMAQVRNLLRGVAYAVRTPPAQVLAALDGAMHDLAVNVLATAVLAQVEQGAADAARGVRTLRWCNAGHPPPVLLEADGSARLLQATPDPLLGMNVADRSDHTTTLHAGSSVVFYTDGLVERRDASLSDRFAWLVDVLAGQQDRTAEQLADHLLAQVGVRGEDDVALLVLRVHDDVGGRPAEAGPEVLPADLRTTGA